MGRFQDFLTQNPVKTFLAGNATGYRRDIARSYAETLRLESASAGEIEAHQERRMRSLLAAASENPYYARLFAESGIRPEQFRLQQLSRLPFLTKETLRSRGRELLLPGARGVYENFSGGSTGVPVRFWQDCNYRVAMSAATRRTNEQAGAFPGARVAKLWGAPQDRRQIEGLAGRAKLWLLNMRYYDTFDMGAGQMRAYHDDMRRFAPDLIQAYASSIYLLAKYLDENHIRPDYPRGAIITSAEKLFPHMRRQIERVFPARVFDRYGSREVSAMAGECREHDGLHIQMPGYIVETIDARTGAQVEETPGEIVITVLNNYALPFLRYRIGDRGILTRAACPCGSRFHRLREILGRTSDHFLMPDGRIVHGEYFTHLFYGRNGIRQFQFVQESRNEFTLRIVPAPHYSRDIARALEREIREVIGREAGLQIETREEIPCTPSGKYRFTISRIPLEELVASGERSG